MFKGKEDILKILDENYLIKEIPGVFWLECCDCKFAHLVIITWADRKKEKVKIALIPETEKATQAKRKVAGIKLQKTTIMAKRKSKIEKKSKMKKVV